MSVRRKVTVLYGEKKLQTTFELSLPSSATVATVKNTGFQEILKHLRLQAGVPQDISIDPDCTDFFPVAPDNIRIQDLDHDITVVVWPKPAPGSDLTPSPIMDTLGNKTAQLDDARSKLSAHALIKEEEQSKLRKKSKPASSSSPQIHAASKDDNMSMSEMFRMFEKLQEINRMSEERNHRLEERNNKLEERNNKLEESITELKETNHRQEESITELKATMQTTMEAVSGDRAAINKIRNRILLDMGRNKLAVICGHRDWKAWKANCASRDDIFNCAVARLETPGDDLTHQWFALGRRRTALQMLLLPNSVRDRGDLAAHLSAKKTIGESVLSLTVDREREDMTAIFRAVYEEEPAH